MGIDRILPRVLRIVAKLGIAKVLSLLRLPLDDSLSSQFLIHVLCLSLRNHRHRSRPLYLVNQAHEFQPGPNTSHKSSQCKHAQKLNTWNQRCQRHERLVHGKENGDRGSQLYNNLLQGLRMGICRQHNVTFLQWRRNRRTRQPPAYAKPDRSNRADSG